jgi:hypothetical protein
MMRLPFYSNVRISVELSRMNEIDTHRIDTHRDDDLAINDKMMKECRYSVKEANCEIIKKMLTLRHNMKYNQHLVSVYMKAKEIFDKMVEEHRTQIQSLDEIHRHIHQMIRENLLKTRTSLKYKSNANEKMILELTKDKTKIGRLLKKMRENYEKLLNIDTVIGVSIDKVNELSFMDDLNYNNDNMLSYSEDDNDVEPYDSSDEMTEIDEGEDSEDEDEDEDSEDEDSEDSEDEGEYEYEDEDENDKQKPIPFYNY